MKNKMILKITIAIVVIAVIAIIIYFFSRNVNKNSKMGNNLSNKTNQEIEEYISGGAVRVGSAQKHDPERRPGAHFAQ